MNIVDKPFFVKTFQWASTATPNTNVTPASTRLPRDLMINAMVKAPFQTSRFWKGEICLTIQAIGTPLHQGLLVVYFKPFQSEGSLDLATSINDALAGPHVFIYANQSSSTCLNVPFCVPASYASTNFNLGTSVYNKDDSIYLPTLGFIHAMVITPLTSLSTTTINVSIHAQFKNMQFKVPKNELMTIPTTLIMRSAESKDKDKDTKDSGEKDKEKEKETKELDPGTKPQAMPILTAIATAALPSVINFVRDGIDKFNKKFWTWIGLDKPTNPLVNENMRVTTTTNYNNTVGIVPLDRMTMHTSHLSLADSNLFPSEVDEMAMDYILSKQQYVTQFLVRSTDVTGANRCAIPIGPLCYPPTLGSNANLPLITKMAMLTKYWRGDLDFHFKVSGTDMQTCKLLFVKAYGLGEYTNVPLYTDLVNFDCESVEINHGGQEFVINCPYNSPMLMLNNDNNYQSSYNQHGVLLVYVITPLQFPSSAQPYITISAYVTAGKSFSFYGPCEQTIYIPVNNSSLLALNEPGMEEINKIETARIKKDIEQQLIPDAYEEIGFKPSPELEEQISKELNAFILSGVSVQSVNVAVGHIEDEDPDRPTIVKSVVNNRMAPIKHVRDIVRRYYMVQSSATGPNVVFRINNLFRSRINNSPLALISNFYDGLRGGIRFRINAPQVTANFKIQVYYVFPSFNSQSSIGVAPTASVVTNAAWNYAPATLPSVNEPINYVPLLVTYNQMDSCVDFEITNENTFAWNKIWTGTSGTATTDNAANLGHLIICFPAGSVGTGLTYRLFASFADETRLGMFMHNNTVILPSSGATFASNFAATVPAAQNKYFSPESF